MTPSPQDSHQGRRNLIIFLSWVDAPAADGPHKIPDNRFRRWSDKGILV